MENEAIWQVYTPLLQCSKITMFLFSLITAGQRVTAQRERRCDYQRIESGFAASGAQLGGTLHMSR
jgi:hypothetical protein